MHPDTEPALRQLITTALTADSIRSRSGVAALRDHRAEDASMVGLLSNLADSETLVAVTTTTGVERRGLVEVVGTNGFTLLSQNRTRSIFRLSAIASLRYFGSQRFDGDGSPTTTMSWPTMIAAFIEPLSDVVLMVGHQQVLGRVRNISRSILQISTPGDQMFYAVVDAIEELSLNVPGSIRQD
ncbi:MAG: hypothetical protein WEA11_09370 [Acidimicrobiales bacterium]